MQIKTYLKNLNITKSITRSYLHSVVQRSLSPRPRIYWTTLSTELIIVSKSPNNGPIPSDGGSTAASRSSWESRYRVTTARPISLLAKFESTLRPRITLAHALSRPKSPLGIAYQYISHSLRAGRGPIPKRHVDSHLRSRPCPIQSSFGGVC